MHITSKQKRPENSCRFEARDPYLAQRIPPESGKKSMENLKVLFIGIISHQRIPESSP